MSWGAVGATAGASERGAQKSGAQPFNEASYRQLVQEVPAAIRRALTPLPALSSPSGPAPSDTLFSREQAAYMPESDSLMVYGSPRQLNDELRRTIFHEWGHALAVRTMDPRALCQWAAQATPWSTVAPDCASATGLRSPVLLQSHPLAAAPAFVLEERSDVPSRYAMSSIHEYFAETFAAWLLAQVKGPPSDKPSPDKVAVQTRQLALLGIVADH